MKLSGRVFDGDLHYERQLTATRGKIEEVHPVSRDAVRLNFPCFLTDARYDAGMSGSPVASDDGRVVGVVCSSSEPPEGPFLHLVRHPCSPCPGDCRSDAEGSWAFRGSGKRR